VGVAALLGPALRQGFWNSDDWFHIEVAAGLLRLDGAAWSMAFTGHVPSDALRLTSYVLWAGDYLLFGLAPGGYYATNVAVHLLTVAGVFGVAHRLSGSVGSGVAAGALFGLNPATTESLYFLSAREDSLCVLLFVGVVAAWPRLRASSRGAWLGASVYLLACFSKLPAVSLPVVLVAVEGLERRRTATGDSGSPDLPLRTLAVPFLVAGAVYAVALGATVDVAAALSEVGASNPRASGELLLCRAQVLYAPASALAGEGLLTADRVVLGAAAGAAAAAVGLRRFGLALPLLGAAWLLACLPAPSPWLLHEVMPGALGGRYLLLPSVGGALLLAGLLPRGGTRASTAAGLVVGVVLAGAAGAGFAAQGSPLLTLHRSSAAALMDTLDGELGKGPPRRIVVALQRPDRGVVSLLASRLIQLRFPSIEEPPAVYLQGSGRLLGTQLEAYDYGVFEPIGEVPPLAELASTVLVVSDRHRPAAGGAGWTTTWEIWRPGADGTARSGSALGAREVREGWDFRLSPMGWSDPVGDGLRGGGSRWEQGEGHRLRGRRRMNENSLGYVLEQPRERLPRLLASPLLELPPAARCGLELELTLTLDRPADRPDGDGVLERPFTLVAFSARADFSDAFAGMFVVPLEDGRQRIHLRVADSPAWQSSEMIRRIGISAPSEPGEIVLHGVEFAACP
jgi:hypothetical protein